MSGRGALFQKAPTQIFEAVERPLSTLIHNYGDVFKATFVHRRAAENAETDFLLSGERPESKKLQPSGNTAS